jgi:rod shape-determining protein MreD
MIDPIRASRFGHRLLYLGLIAILLFLRILPLTALPPGIPGPDLALGLTMAWVLRRPDYVPVVLIAAVVLLEDLLFMRPPGLWALIVVLGTEFLRRREVMTRDLPFVLEWVLIGAVLFAMIFANRLVLQVFLVPQTPLWLVLIQGLTTLAAYPAVVFLTRHVLGLHRAAIGEVDELGHLR